MALHITDYCINCGICETECPNHAIYPPSDKWNFADGTLLSGDIVWPDGRTEESEAKHEAISHAFYYIVPWKCTECVGFHEKPKCASVCPANCCIKDPEFVETKKELLEKKEFLH